MLSSQVQFSADRQTDRQIDTGKTICPLSIDAGALKYMNTIHTVFE